MDQERPELPHSGSSDLRERVLFNFFRITYVFRLGSAPAAILAKMGCRMNQFDIRLRILYMQFVFNMAAKRFFIFTHDYLLC